jgi:integrase
MAHITYRPKKDGSPSYLIKVYSGKDPITNKQRKPYVRTWPDKNEVIPEGWSKKTIEKEVNRIAAVFEDNCKRGIISTERQNFFDYAEYVMKLKERTGTKHRTIVRYNDLLERIIPAIGHLKLTDIRPQHLNDFYEQLSQEGLNKKTKGKLSDKTILEHHRLISTIMTQAEKEGLIISNPAPKATPPKVTKRDVNYFNIDDVERIRDCLDLEVEKDEEKYRLLREKYPHRADDYTNPPAIKWRMATHLLLLSGCRRGEIMGLKWSKIDFQNKQMKIDKSLLYAADLPPGQKIYEDSTKTSTTRFIKLPDETMELLKEYKKWYSELRIKNGKRWANTDYLFVKDDGSPMHPDSLTDWLDKFSKRYDLPHINPHAFRHTMASVLISAGQDIVSVSKRLGHAKVSTTTDIYSHIMKQADEAAAECIANVLIRPKNESQKLG